MRDSRAVCLLCRLSSASRSIPPPGPSLWAARSAGFGTASSNANSAAGLPHRDPLLGDEDGVEDTGSSAVAGTASTTRHPRLEAQSLSGSLSRPIPKRRPPRTKGEGALAVFRQIVDKQREEGAEGDPKAAAAALASGQPEGSEFGMHLYEELVKLSDLRRRADASVAAQFEFFDRSMLPYLRRQPRDMPRIFRDTAAHLLIEVSKAKQQDYFSKTLPSVTYITKVQRQLGLLKKPQHWTPLVLGLVEEILKIDIASSDEPVAAVEEGLGEEGSATGSATESAPTPDLSQGLREELLRDLVGAWRMFCLPDLVLSDEGTLAAAAGQFRVPPPDTQLIAKYLRSGKVALAVATMFPRYAPQELQTLPAAVVATYLLLTDPVRSSPAIEEDAKDFLLSITNTLREIHADRHDIAAMYSSSPDLQRYALERWGQGRGWPQADLSKNSRIRGAHSDYLHKQLGRALKARNLEACEKVWDKFWDSVNVPDAAERAQKLRDGAEMFDYFIMAFATMRQLKRALEVWNLMVGAGVQPTLKTWTSFIEGCKRAASAVGIQNIWDKLIASHVQLDTAVWTARISGLIQAGQPRAGLEALMEMQRLWEEEPRLSSRSPVAVKPSIEPVNAAIAGFMRRGDQAAAKNILAWAGQHGIEPDIFTFNTLLRPLVREGRSEEVSQLLGIMRQQGIQADAATFTTLLDGAFGGALAEQPAEAQAATVERTVADMEAAGVEVNLQTYAKMIYVLLREGARAEPAVDAVLASIRARGLELSSHICTILAEYYFEQDPPNVAAVRALVEGEGSRSSRRGGGRHHQGGLGFDRVFWERVVRGYAQVGDTASALRHFENIAGSLSVTTSTLEDLLRALIRNRQWDEAYELVRRVKAQKEQGRGDHPEVARDGAAGGGGDGSEARLWRHRFWHLASEHGLL